MHVVFSALRTYAIPFDAIYGEDPFRAIGFMFST